MTQLTVEIIKQQLTNAWVAATWNQFLEVAGETSAQKSKCYYYNGQMRIEIMPVGPDHASDNGIIYLGINLFCTLKSIAYKGFINCSYRKPELREAQPDISYYLGAEIQAAPSGSSVVNLNQFSSPSLVIEISDTTLADDKGEKRLLYEEMEVQEYWVVDVQKSEIIAFEILKNGGSRRILTSQVLPNLAISVLEEALEISHQPDQSQVTAWLLNKFQS
ncbi:MAG TPA: hypothetical protein DCQ51_07195 [Planktothrix sp. UBA8407]|nr:hypothetical protein [Planktothrix sp. UBA8402]HAO10947.1 hypothetical protein [Planktothrix sp. UBA8407]